ncbi:HVA1 family protein [Paraburkholderia sp. Tr-20389]|nr:HVA1 family protein [Paraburkholderia sp. Tr-20389]
MSSHLKTGDRVSWNMPQWTTAGRAITTYTEFDGHTVAVSKDDAHDEVESEKSGKRAFHRAEALHKTPARRRRNKHE